VTYINNIIKSILITLFLRKLVKLLIIIHVANSPIHAANSPRPKKARQVRSNVKAMLITFFDFRGIVHRKWVSQGHTVNQYFYLVVMKRLCENVRKKRPESWKSGSWMLHHDNALAHSSLLIRQFLAKNQTPVVPQQPYSPDLALCDFFLFQKLKSTLKGRRFQTIGDIKQNTEIDLKDIPIIIGI